jgi:hypothetical protein
VVALFRMVICPPIMRKFVNLAPLRMWTSGRGRPGRGPKPAQLTSFISQNGLPGGSAGISQGFGLTSESSNSRILRPSTVFIASTRSCQLFEDVALLAPPRAEDKGDYRHQTPSLRRQKIVRI